MSRRSGHRFADERHAPTDEPGACSDSAGIGTRLTVFSVACMPSVTRRTLARMHSGLGPRKMLVETTKSCSNLASRADLGRTTRVVMPAAGNASTFIAAAARRPMTNIPTELLRTYVTVVDLRSFHRAAHALGVTQPAVSAQLKRLQQ